MNTNRIASKFVDTQSSDLSAILYMHMYMHMGPHQLNNLFYNPSVQTKGQTKFNQKAWTENSKYKELVNKIQQTFSS